MGALRDRLNAAKNTPMPQKAIAPKIKMVGPKGAKVPVSAQRPTLEAAPTLARSNYMIALGNRANTRSRSMFNLIKEMSLYNPYISKAVDNIATLLNPGYKVHVYFSGKKDADGRPIADVQGQVLLQSFMVRMMSEYSGAWDEVAGSESNYPGLDCLLRMAPRQLMQYGGAAFEVELNESLDDIVDVYPVDPTIVDFRPDPATNRLVPGLQIQNAFTPLDQVRFRYIGKDPDPLQPGGTSPLLAVIDTVFFQQQFMRELQAVIHFNNSPRLDIKVLEEVAVKALDETRPDLKDPANADARQTYLDGFLTDLKTYIDSLQADDALIHWDSVEATYITPKGTAFPVGDVIAALDKMLVAGTKQLPLLLGLNEGATTTHATVQWQIFIRHLEDYQRIVQSLATWALNLYLRIQGRQSYAALEFEQHKTSDELLDAQALNIKALTYGYMVDRGWVPDDEAAMELVNHVATGTPKPALEAADPNPDVPSGPPRIQPNGGDRAVNDNVHDMPTWTQPLHHDALKRYGQWRSMSIAPKFGQAAHELVKASKAVANMSTSDAQKWLHRQLRLDDADQGRLRNTLRESGRITSKATIEEQLRMVNKPQIVKLTDRKLLRVIDDRARDSARSVVDTYNTELLNEIQLELVDESRDAGDDIITKIRKALGSLAIWERLRDVWKAGQVAFAEVQTNIMRSVQEFFDRNEVEGEAEVYPYDSTPDICADYIAMNPYSSMREALAQTDLPAHPNCPHFVRLVGSGTISGPVWAGAGD